MPKWQPIATLPKERVQVLVTTAEDIEDGTPDYGDFDLACCPMLADGRLLSQITGNYVRAGVWKYWMPAPSKDKSQV